MVLGDLKGAILKNILATSMRSSRNRVVVEVGSYCGYSAVLMAAVLQPDDVILSIENDPSCARWTQDIIALAQVENHRLLQGNVESMLPSVRKILVAMNKTGHCSLSIVLGVRRP